VVGLVFHITVAIVMKLFPFILCATSLYPCILWVYNNLLFETITKGY
jgi:hypothetical protein